VPKVASNEFAIALNDYYEVSGLRYTLTSLAPRQFSATKTGSDIPLLTPTEITTGTDTAAKTISAKDLKDAIEAKTATKNLQKPGRRKSRCCFLAHPMRQRLPEKRRSVRQG
jgi:hypothetical protein